MRIGPFGVWEILIILVVVLLIFGPRRLPEMAKGLGQSVRAFRKELRDMKSDLDFDGPDDANASRTRSAPPPSSAASPAGAPPGSGTPPASEAVPTPVREDHDAKA